MDITNRLSELELQLQTARKREHQLCEELQDLSRKCDEVPRQMALKLGRMKSELALVESDCSQLGSALSLCSALAENVSGRVRRLDLARSRVVDCLQRVEDVLDLRLCAEGVSQAMLSEDYEQACAHVHRYLALRDAIGSLAQLEGLENSCAKLQQAEVELAAVVQEKFDQAVIQEDLGSMQRFFKLFPLLNLHILGLEKMGICLRDMMRNVADKNYAIMQAGGQDDTRTTVLYADTLTLLLEGAARTIEMYQPLVETYYQPGKLIILLKILQEECDIQANKILKEFNRARQFDNKAKLLPTNVVTSRKLPTSQSHTDLKSYQFEQKLDPRDLDTILAEVTLITTRAELYIRFLRRRLASDINAVSTENCSEIDKKQKLGELEKWTNQCLLSRQMQDIIGQYIALEEYFMRESILKAVSHDQREPDQLTSSMVDDVFFIVRKCVRRALASSSVDCVCAMLNHANAALETDYFNVLYQRLKSGYPAVGSLAEAYTTAAAAYSSMMQQGKIPSSSGESAEKARDQFITALNNVETSRECCNRLREALQIDIENQFGATETHARKKIDSCLASLTDVCAKFLTAVQYGVEQLVDVSIKPRLKSWAETFLDYSHSPTEHEFDDFEVNDPFMQKFLANLDQLLVSFKDSLTEKNNEILVKQIASELARQLEKVILKTTFNRYGGLQLDKELRELTQYLTAVADWAVREKFVRLTQIANVLNVESISELKDICEVGNNSVPWRLTPTEIRKFLALRIDLPGEDISNLKL